jgi:hypothetical protein
MFRTLIAGLAVVSLACVGTADAATKKKTRHAEPVAAQPAPAPAPVAPYQARTSGPPFAGPGECYTDEGYGRYWPCGAGRD